MSMTPSPQSRLSPRPGLADPLIEATDSMLRIATHVESNLAQRPISELIEICSVRDVAVAAQAADMDLAKTGLGRLGADLPATPGRMANGSEVAMERVLWVRSADDIERSRLRGPVIVVVTPSASDPSEWMLKADAVLVLGRPGFAASPGPTPVVELSAASIGDLTERAWMGAKRLAATARLSRSLAMLRERVDAVTGELTVELGIARASRPAVGGPDRRSSSREPARIQAEITDCNRELLLPTAQLASAIRDRLDALSAADLTQSPTPLSVRLGIEADLLSELESTIWQFLRPRLEDDLELLDATGLPRAPSPDALGERMRRAAILSPQYRGDLPRRGFFRRITEGRQPAYLLMMIASIFGGAVGVSTRTAPLAVAMLILFIIGFISTFISWRRQDAELLDREIERLRPLLQQASMDFAQSLTEEKLRAIRAYLEQADESARGTATVTAGTASLGGMRDQELRLRELAEFPKLLDRAATLLEESMRAASADTASIEPPADSRTTSPRSP
jgi:hypothetical protein